MFTYSSYHNIPYYLPFYTFFCGQYFKTCTYTSFSGSFIFFVYWYLLHPFSNCQHTGLSESVESFARNMKISQGYRNIYQLRSKFSREEMLTSILQFCVKPHMSSKAPAFACVFRKRHKLTKSQVASVYHTASSPKVVFCGYLL